MHPWSPMAFPSFALFWGFVYGEKVTLIELVSLGIILSGVYLANRPEKKVEIEEEF